MEDQAHTYSKFVESNKPQERAPREEEVYHPQTPLGQKRLILLATSKGGVGKSYLSINLAEWLESLQVPFVAFDPDWCNSSLTRFYEKAEFLDISESVNLDNVIRALDRTDLGFSYW